MSSTRTSTLFLAFTLAGAFALLAPANAQPIIPANDGTGTIVNPNNNRFDITGGQQSGDGTNLFHSFTEFGLNEGQIANFLSQPNIANILARINGGNVSYINGLIKVTGSNANLFLMNPSGIVFGANARLNLPGAFTATTANAIGFNHNWFNAIGSNNYAELVGKPNTFAFTSTQPAAIANLGELSVGAGQDLSLLAGRIENSGKLSAPGGNITIAAVPGENLVRISQTGFALSLEIATKDNSPSAITNSQTIISNPINIPQLLTGGNLTNATEVIKNSDGTITLTGSNGQIFNQGQLSTASSDKGGQINIVGRLGYNLGQIVADGEKGGNIQIEINNLLDTGTLSAKGTSGEGGNIAVNYTGRVIQTSSAATTVNGQTRGGTIAFQGGANTVFTSSGNFSATGEQGGTVRLFGENVRLLASNIDASGKIGGGEILVGGDFQGRTQGAINAQNTIINHASNLTANAQTRGNGGRVIVWSDKQTTFAGNVTAQGGTVSGNGGFVEISGKENLTMSGAVNVGAFNGLAGTLLLDPKNIVIDDITGGFPSFDLVDPNPGGTGTNMQTVPLSTGNIVVAKPGDNIGGNDAGAVYLYNGFTGALISTLTGSTAGNQVGGGGVIALTNGNYVVRSGGWDNGAIANVGAVTWGSGTTGVNGPISAANSLVGTTANDRISNAGVIALTNGNYVVNSPTWDNGAIVDAGAVTWGDGTIGVTGAVSAANSLVGTTANDQVGTDLNGGVIALTNGNYVVRSRLWNNGAVTDAGAVTWGNGATGITGAVSAANSLVGTKSNDWVGSGGVIALSNGNYVVTSQFWNNGAVIDAGAVTWGNGSTGTTGAVSAANSLVGSTDNDQVGGGGITVLSNGNYVVSSISWDNGAIASVGAVTWGDGKAGVAGPISAANSLIGSTANDRIGNGKITALTNGNYVVSSPDWDNGTVTDVGAATWGDGSTGISGAISTTNSLVGSTIGDRVSNGGVTALTNGNYVANSPLWDNGGIADAGAATWGNGSTGITGAVSTANSLVGTTANDQVSSGGITFLSNGNYVVNSPLWDNGGVTDAGAATWINGSTGQTLDSKNIVSRENSVFGQTASAGLSTVIEDRVNNTFLVLFSAGSGRVAVGFDNPNPNLLTFSRGQNSTVTLTTNFLRQTLDTGTAVVLQANNDITLNSPITTNNPTGNGGDLTFQAGRSIILNPGANITTDNGNLTLTANDTAANGVVDTERSAGQAVINIAPGVIIDSGTGDTTITLSTGAGLTNNSSGDITLDANINARNLTIENKGPNNGAVIIPDTANINLTGNFQQIGNSPVKLGSNITSTGGNIVFDGAVTLTGDIILDASAGNGAIALNNIVDSTSGENLTLQAGNGSINFNDAVGNTQSLGNVTANSSGNTNFNSTIKAATIITDASGTTKINGDITTTGDQIYNDALTLTNSLTLSTSNGNLNFNNTIDGTTAGTENLSITTASGDITLKSAIGSTTKLANLTINNFGITNIVDTADINLDGIFDQIGSGTVNTAGDIVTSNDDIRFSGPVTLTGNVNFNLGTAKISFGSTLTASNYQLNFRAGEIDFTGAVTGSNTLTLEPATAEQNILIGGTSDSSTTTLDLTATDINALQPGFSNITIGRTDSSGAITINNNVTFKSPVTIQSPATGGSITAKGIINLESVGLELKSDRHIVTNSIISNGGNITLTSQTGEINTSAGTIDSSSTNNDGGAVNLNSPGNITTNRIISAAPGTTGKGGEISITSGGIIHTNGGEIDSSAVNGAGGNVNFNANNNIITSNIAARSDTNAGGNITLNSQQGSIESGNLNASGNTLGGEIRVLTPVQITTKQINSSAITGNGGNVTLDPLGDIQVEYINAQGGTAGTGGSVDITTARFFRATGSFADRNGLTSSISTAGGTGGGSIAIRHGGGPNTAFNVVGDATTNGTVGNITTGTGTDQTLTPGPYFGPFTQGQTQIITEGAPLSTVTSGNNTSTLPNTTENNTSTLPNTTENSNSTLPDTTENSNSTLPDTTENSNSLIIPEESTQNQSSNEETRISTDIDIERRTLPSMQVDISGIVRPSLDTTAILRENIAANLDKGNLDRAISQIEQLRRQEYENYFGEKLPVNVEPTISVTQIQNILGKIAERPGKKPAILYVFIQFNQLDLILVTPSGKPIYRRVAEASKEKLLKVVAEFRSEITSETKIDTTSYLSSAQQLYKWLIAPIEPELKAHGIENLALSLDPGLRSTPVAALHDGQRFLTEKYSMSLIPSVNLLNIGYQDIRNAAVLGMGAEKFTELEPLPAVPVEISNITNKIWSGSSFLNQDFTLENFRSQSSRNSFKIIHLATHGDFKSGEPNNSFIQFWNTQLNLHQLRKMNWHNSSVELLVLSACRTAVGDEQAELGFGGLAVAAGVKSALASLWYVSDRGTLALMTEFYEHLKNVPIKAEALQQAQIAMIKEEVKIENDKLFGLSSQSEGIALPVELSSIGDQKLSHPYYWSAFTMIGSPW